METAAVLSVDRLGEEGGDEALQAYIRNMRVPLLKRAQRVVQVADSA